MLQEAIRDARAWTTTSIDDSSYWYYPVPDACMRAFEQMRHREGPTPGAPLAADQRSACAAALAPVLSALEMGRGFAIIEGPDLPPEEARLLYWIIGQSLGRPFEQNVEGVMLYDVRDTGQDLSKGARFSVTSYESSFHTDNSFGTDILDYVGLLCLNTAKSGGRSQVLSGYAVHNELLHYHPDVLAMLYQPVHVDRRGGVRDGESPTIQFSVIARHAGERCELLFRYLRYWIEAGHEKIGQPLTPIG